MSELLASGLVDATRRMKNLHSEVDMDGAGFGTLWRVERSGVKMPHPRGQGDLLVSGEEQARDGTGNRMHGFEIASTGREQVDLIPGLLDGSTVDGRRS